MKKNAVLPFLMVTLMITSGCSKGLSHVTVPYNRE